LDEAIEIVTDFNVILQALPISSSDGQYKSVLRPPKDDKDTDDERTKQAVRQPQAIRLSTPGSRNHRDIPSIELHVLRR